MRYIYNNHPSKKGEYKIYEPLKDVQIPDVYSLNSTPNEPPIYDQGQLGSCTANAITYGVQFAMNKQGLKYNPSGNPSRLFVYYNERAKEGTINSDSGANISDGIDSVNEQGVCSEIVWPYDIDRFTDKPSDKAYSLALLDKVTLKAQVLQDENSISSCISAGFPVITGITVYESLEAQQTIDSGTIPMPDIQNEKELGGHAIALCGYDRINKVYTLRNSWGTSVGQNGYFTIPFDYIHNPDLCSDLWQIDFITQVQPIPQIENKSIFTKLIDWIKNIF